MPLDGTLDVSTVLADAPEVPDLTPDAWELPGASLVQASLEIEEAPALAAIPPSLHPSVPPYATFGVIDVPDSPVGPFVLAQVRIVARAGIRPRGLLVGAVCNSADAAEALASRWGYRVEVGEVSLSRRHDRWVGRASRDGEVAMEVVCRDPTPIGGSDVDLIASLHLARHDGDGVIIQVDPEYVFHDTNRGHAELPVFDTSAWGVGPMAASVVPTSPAIAIACTADTDIPTPRFVMDPAKPALSGTRRLAA